MVTQNQDLALEVPHHFEFATPLGGARRSKSSCFYNGDDFGATSSRAFQHAEATNQKAFTETCFSQLQLLLE